MAIQKTKGIVLKRQDLRETSLIITLFTQDFGKIRGVAKGIKKAPGKFGTIFMPFSLNEVIFYERSRSNAPFLISQAEVVDVFPRIRSDLAKSACAYYFLELLERLTELFDKDEALFQFLYDALMELSDSEAILRARSKFEAGLLMNLGVSHPEAKGAPLDGLIEQLGTWPLNTYRFLEECLSKSDQ